MIGKKTDRYPHSKVGGKEGSPSTRVLSGIYEFPIKEKPAKRIRKQKAENTKNLQTHLAPSMKTKTNQTTSR